MVVLVAGVAAAEGVSPVAVMFGGAPAVAVRITCETNVDAGT
ncbi:MAG: hypothetical protein ACXVY8_06950 [Gaiellaceae bacterium]